MAVTLEAFGIDKLSVGEQIELVHLLTVRVSEAMPPPTPELIALLRERVADAEANPDDEMSHEDVLAEWAREDGREP